MTKANSQQWEQLISDYRSSGMTGKAWCKEKGIKESTLYYWIKRAKNKSSKTESNTKWASLSLTEGFRKTSAAAITIKLRDFSLEIEPGFDKAALVDVLSIVMQLC